jgi:hypothetical protein
MNDFAKRMLSDRMRNKDGRNPYGSKGGYVDSNYDSRGYKNMNMSSQDGWYDDIRRFPNMYNLEYPDREYEEGYEERLAKQREKDSRRYEDQNNDMYSRKYNGINNDMSSRRYGTFDYETEDGHFEKLTSKDIKKWNKMLENADGTRGPKFEQDKVKQVAQMLGVKMEDYDIETLTMATNMLYSDYCKILGNDLAVYVKMARAFLEDDDFDGEPAEKLMLYYKCIVE